MKIIVSCLDKKKKKKPGYQTPKRDLYINAVQAGCTFSSFNRQRKFSLDDNKRNLSPLFVFIPPTMPL